MVAAIAKQSDGVQRLQDEARRCEAAHAALVDEIATLQAQQIGISMNQVRVGSGWVGSGRLVGWEQYVGGWRIA